MRRCATVTDPARPADTVVLPGAPGDEWLARPSQLAELALGSAASAQGLGHHTLGRHLAYLPLESLDLDLDDPLQRDFGDYTLLERLGQGGMGVVYRARQHSLDREVAIKLLAAGPWASQDFIERFRREAQSAARMQHPNIVAIHEVGSSAELNYFSMQLVRGESLAALCARERRLEPRRAAGLVRTVAEAVDYAHRLGVLHLDMKPGNVLIDERGEPLVADFGLARRLDESLPQDGGEVSGTPSYMAPEQATATGRLQPATDVYGLGAVLYELLTGAPPFLGATPQATLEAVVLGELVPARVRVRTIPADLDAICSRCLAKDPARRYASARALADDLAAFLEGRTVSVRPLGVLQRVGRWARRQPRQAALAGMLAASLLGGLLATSLQWRRAEGNAAVSRSLLWESRRTEATRLATEGRGFDGAALLLANIEDAERSGRAGLAEADRRRLGTLLAQGLQLVDRIVVDDASPTTAELSPDGALLAVGFDDLSVRWYETASMHEAGRVSLVGQPTSEDMGGFQRVPWLLRFVGEGRLRVNLEWYDHWIRPGDRDTSLIDLEQGALLLPPAGAVEYTDATFSADGRHAVLHLAEGQAQLWQVTPWKPLGPSFALPRPPMPLLLTRDAGLAFALAPSMAGVRLFDPRAPEREIPLALPRDAGLAAWTQSADGARVAIGDHAGRIHLIDVATRRVQRIDRALRDEISWLGFSEDDRWLAAGSTGGAVMVFDAASGDALLPDSLQHEFPIGRVLLVRHQQLLVATGADQVALWRLPEPGTLAHRPHRLHTSPTPMPGAGAYAVSLAAQGGLLATASISGEIRLWQVPESPLLPIRGAAGVPEQPVTAGVRMAEVAYDRLRVARLDGTESSEWIGFAEPPSFAELYSGDRKLAVVSGREVHLLDAVTLRPDHPPIILPGSPQRLLSADEGALLVFSIGEHEPGRGFLERLVLVDPVAGEVLPQSVSLPGPLLLRASADGRRMVAIGPRSGESTLFELPSLDVLGRRGHDPDSPVLSASFAADQRSVLLIERAPDPVAADDALVLWQPELASGFARRALPGLTPLAAAAAGGQVYVGGQREDRLIGQGSADRRVTRLSRAQGTSPLAVSADGSWLARGYRYRDVELIDPVGAVPLGPPLYWNTGGIQMLVQLAFARDDSALLARTSQGRWLRWPLAVERRSSDALRDHLAPLLGAGGAAADADRTRRLPGAHRVSRWPHRAPPPALPSVGEIGGEPLPPRSAAATPLQLDLGPVYTLAPTGQWRPRDHVIASIYPVPWGLQRLGGVDFDIRGAIGLNAPSGPEGDGARPSRVTGVVVPPVPVAAFHVLLLAGGRSAQADALEYARLRLHYADGGEAVLPILTQRDVPGWTGNDGDVRMAWEYGGHLRALGEPLSLPVNAPRLVNPYPHRLAVRLDIESGSGTWNAPVVFAITAEPVIEHAACCNHTTSGRQGEAAIQPTRAQRRDEESP